MVLVACGDDGTFVCVVSLWVQVLLVVAVLIQWLVVSAAEGRLNGHA